ncbi:MAG TPA: hypothetical protein VGL61_11780 [Kofleriaceae bacterium]|jgi:hypothetical protein
MSRAWLIVVVACEGSAPPSQVKPAPVAPPVAADAAIADAAIADAAIAACPDYNTVHKFRFGTLSAPAGSCWRRTAEGDDQSGVLTDGANHVQLTYTQMSFDENVGDACRGKPARDVRIGAVRYTVCELGSDRTCASFHGAANVCGDAKTLESVLQTLAPKR